MIHMLSWVLVGLLLISDKNYEIAYLGLTIVGTGIRGDRDKMKLHVGKTRKGLFHEWD